MQRFRPSPSMVVSIIAVVIASAGTAGAAGILIKNSSQVATGAISGSDIKNNAITTSKLAASVRNALTSQGFVAREASRRSGPVNTPAGQAIVATLTGVQPGTYLITAKTTLTPSISNLGLGEILRQNKTVNAECVLNAGGDADSARGTIASPYSNGPNTFNMQMTRTLGTAVDVNVTCTVPDASWSASDTSIVALKLSGSSRTDVTG